ncbi:hypothetical protein [Brevundimonas sp. UBA5713]|uniref:hypothetical protein n=1 Tax=Brevundimonas sp. UBA5713 TaxID=1946130 RepID=UPI0025C50E24|nr:hypothetical protein [Brevundimonas sp. UBA5713]
MQATTINPPTVQTESVRLPALEGPLRSWLLEETSDVVAIKAIAGSEILRGQAAMLLPALRHEALKPATPQEIVGIIRSREQTFGDLRTKRTDAEWTMFWADYFEALKGLTAASIEAGMKAYVALPDAEWAPKPGKLAALARETTVVSKFSRAWHRAKTAIQQAAQPKAPEPKPVVKDSPEQVKAMVSEVKQALDGTPTAMAMKARRTLHRPPSAPLEAGSHMSAEMRAKLIEQGVIVAPVVQNEEAA